MMRKILVLILSLFTFIVNAQQFELTEHGFIDADNYQNDYVVLEFHGHSQEAIYQQLHLFFAQYYKSAKDVLTLIENKSMTINAFSENQIRRNKLHAFDLHYTIILSFKDDRVKFEIGSIRMRTFTNKSQELYIKSSNSLDGSRLGVYNSKGVLRSKLAKQDLENFFNKMIYDLKDSSVEDDW